MYQLSYLAVIATLGLLFSANRLVAEAEVVEEAYLKASNAVVDPFDRLADDWFGWSLAIDGDTLVVGAWNEASAATGVNSDEDDNSADWAGAAYVFVRDGNGWRQQAYLKASDTEEGDRFGRSVAISGDTVVISAPQKSSEPGAYVFVREGEIWRQQTKLVDVDGSYVAIDGETLVAGRRVGSHGGEAVVFVRSGERWEQEAVLRHPLSDGSNSHSLYTFAIDGDIIVAGAHLENTSPDRFNITGAAYVFVRSGETWVRKARLTASVVTLGFGEAIDIDGDTIVVGALNDFGDSIPGAFVFVQNGETWTQAGSPQCLESR